MRGVKDQLIHLASTEDARYVDRHILDRDGAFAALMEFAKRATEARGDEDPLALVQSMPVNVVVPHSHQSRSVSPGPSGLLPPGQPEPPVFVLPGGPTPEPAPAPLENVATLVESPSRPERTPGAGFPFVPAGRGPPATPSQSPAARLNVVSSKSQSTLKSFFPAAVITSPTSGSRAGRDK